ncbi:MAG: phage scaffolding protein [Bacteroides sp.]|nr:phage scaffolding protein [Bacteroides sp.]
MTLEEHLSGLALSADKLGQIGEALKNEYVAKSEYERALEGLSVLEAELAKKNELSDREREDASARQKAAYERRLFELLLKAALKEAGARNSEIVEALLDKERLSLDGERISGLSEQLARLRKKAPFLFEDSVMFLTGYRPEASSDILPEISAEDMTYSEAVAFLEREA